MAQQPTPKQSQFPPTIAFPDTKVGEFTKIAHSGFIGHNSEIGRYCSIAANVSIAPYEAPIQYLSTSAEFYKNHTQTGIANSNAPDDPFVFEDFKGCKIGNDVWIGKNAVIMDGINVGDGAVIGANSTVVNDVPPYAVVTGSPARVIKYRFSPEIIERLLALKWWNLPPQMLNNLPYRVESAINTLEQRTKHN